MSKPSLRALRAFSLVHRCGTAAPAASTLGGSPSAVSHLLRDLELTLGLTLFDGKGGSGGLTEAGTRLRDGIGNAFQSIDQAVENTLRRDGEVRASLLTSFATLWLVRRLPLFQMSHPRTRLLVSTDTRAV